MENSDFTNRQRIIRVLKTAMLFLTVALICAVAFGTAYFLGFDITSRLDPQKIYNVEQSTLIYDCNGVEIANVHGLENRIWVPLSDVPEVVQKAFVAAEDVRFYSHSGIDIKRIFGALVNDIKAGKLVEGASTITQQLIKNSLLDSKKVFSRKIEEALLALELERRYTKDEILEMYLNYIYFGANAYGIEAASQTYFSKPASQLTLDEGALLAGILKSTARYAPHNNPDASVARRNTVLNLMAEYTFITNEQAQQAKSKPLALSLSPSNDSYGFYLDAALDEASDILGISYEEVVTSGYRIYTAMDTNLQSILEEAFKQDSLFPANAADGSVAQAAFVCIDPDTGYIMAIMGGRQYEVKRGLNRALNSRRQPGSAIKPVMVYAPALQSRAYSPISVIIDEPKSFNNYTPSNFNDKYMGAVTMREALVKSLNVPAVEILLNTGIPNAKSFASSVGIPFGNNDMGLSLALGGFETGVTPLELCAAYGAFASLGMYRTPTLVTCIQDCMGNILYQSSQEATRVLNEDTAFILADMLRDVVEEGTGHNLYMEDIALSGKTGTNGYGSIGNRDIWMAAFNADLCAVVWMGFDKTDNDHFLPSAATGGTYPAKLLKSVISAYYQDQSAPHYTTPDSVEILRLDKAALLSGDVRIAAGYLLDSDVVEEYLFSDLAAEIKNENNALQCLVYDLTVDLNALGEPVISFSSSSNIASYEILRICQDEAQQIIAKLPGDDRMTYVDKDAQTNKGYTYSVQPVDASSHELGQRSDQVYVYVTKPLV